MKQYLWAGIVVLLVSAHASDNPFDLKENFGKLDKEQEVLLSELKRLAELKEAAEEEVVQEPTIDEVNENKEIVAPTPVIEEGENEVAKSLDTVIAEPVTVVNEQVTEVEKEAQEKQVLLAAVKEKEAELQQLRAEELRQVEAKKDVERREVEAYEKQRAEKLAQQEVEETAALEKEALAQNVVETKQSVQEEVKEKQELEKVTIEKSPKEEVQQELPKKEEATEVKQSEQDKKTGIVDINLTRENEEAKVTADQAYEDAVKEMNKED